MDEIDENGWSALFHSHKQFKSLNYLIPKVSFDQVDHGKKIKF
jgi:hypothetical protein